MTHFIHSFPLQTPSVVGVCWTCSPALPSSTSRLVPMAHIYLFHSFSPCSSISIHHLHLSCLVSALLSTHPTFKPLWRGLGEGQLCSSRAVLWRAYSLRQAVYCLPLSLRCLVFNSKNGSNIVPLFHKCLKLEINCRSRTIHHRSNDAISAFLGNSFCFSSSSSTPTIFLSMIL